MPIAKPTDDEIIHCVDEFTGDSFWRSQCENHTCREEIVTVEDGTWVHAGTESTDCPDLSRFDRLLS